MRWFLIFVLTVTTLVGLSWVWDSRKTDKALGVSGGYHEISNALDACESNLPRNQSCEIQWRAVVAGDEK